MWEVGSIGMNVVVDVIVIIIMVMVDMGLIVSIFIFIVERGFMREIGIVMLVL